VIWHNACAAFASDAFSARNIQFHFVAPNAAHDIPIKTEMRRELLLIFKESVNNAVRHSGCSQAEASLQISNGMIALRVVDNGKGFDAAISEQGNGLASMRQRAAKIGGSFQLISEPGTGTVVELTAPLK
jgi:signal transduction histidine kinase